MKIEAFGNIEGPHETDLTVVKGNGIVIDAKNVADKPPVSQDKVKNSVSISKLPPEIVCIIARNLDLVSYNNFRKAGEYFKDCLGNIKDMYGKYKVGEYTGATKKWLDKFFFFHGLSAESAEFLNKVNVLLEPDKINVNARIFEGLIPTEEEDMKTKKIQSYFRRISFQLSKGKVFSNPKINSFPEGSNYIHDMTINIYIKKSNVAEVKGTCAEEINKMFSVFEDIYKTGSAEAKSVIVHIADKIKHALYEQPIDGINMAQVKEVMSRYNNLFESADLLKEFLNQKHQKI